MDFIDDVSSSACWTLRMAITGDAPRRFSEEFEEALGLSLKVTRRQAEVNLSFAAYNRISPTVTQVWSQQKLRRLEKASPQITGCCRNAQSDTSNLSLPKDYCLVISLANYHRQTYTLSPQTRNTKTKSLRSRYSEKVK
ncbi:hypothetical protein CSKR_107119 [Clonorchis sinensis]|uniref:Uncharacterized protein n=1 Tax=Clonorchis sinensis TaxID=79923 RepID=A0A419Q0C1_CLOSI|nr:hypothetical protein CSKR_107119 [Clonorchis sinensis]